MSTDPTYNYTIADIEQYLSGSMPAAEMHEMEKAALSDPFLADAIDGFRQATPSVTSKHLNEIRSMLSVDEAVSDREAVVIHLPGQKPNWWRGLAAAAVVGILALGAWFFMRTQPKSPVEVAQYKPVEQHTSSSTQDTISAGITQVDSILTPVSEEQQHSLIALNQKVNKEFKKPVVQPRASNAPVVAISAEPAAAPANNLEVDAIANAQTKRNYELDAVVMAARSRMAPVQAIKNANQNPVMAPNGVHAYFVGKVTDEKGNPLPGVGITTPENKSTVSNIDGSFRLPASDSVAALSFAAVGYENKVQNMLSGKVAGIQLEPQKNNLNEIVVVGYGTQKKAPLIGAVSRYKIDTLPYKESPYPQGGWDNFYNNLNTEMGVNQSSATKDLHIRFSVENGLPQNFTIIKTPDEATAQKAISIIKKGPKWKANRKKKKVDLKVKVD